MPGFFDSRERTVMNYQLTSGQVEAVLQLPESAVVFNADNQSVVASLATSLQSPLGLPPIEQCVVPGDRVALVVDPDTPGVADMITLVWEQFQASHGEELDATLLLPADPDGTNWKAIIDGLPVHVRNQVAIHVHDPSDEQQRSYLASSAGGERIYLSHYLTDADLVVTIGRIGFDATFGYRGTNSSIYPAFSNTESINAARPTGNDFAPGDSRPLRVLADEIGWLLGTQFAVQVIPGGDGSAMTFLCGAPDEVMKAGRTLLHQHWAVTADETFELVVVSVPANASNGWKSVGAAVETAVRLAGDGGRVAVVAELPNQIGPAMEMLRRSLEPEDLLKPLRREMLHDAAEVSQLIKAMSHARIYLHSNLDPVFVEELGILPLTSEAELQRLIKSAERTFVLPHANFAWVESVAPATL